jgi:DNA polymerase-3 subunit delta'
MHPWTAPFLESLRQRGESLPHALLVHGPKGIGKLALAERMAQLILCEATDTTKRPCGASEGCRWFVAGSHPDFRRDEPEALAPQREVDADDAPAEPAAKKGKPSIEIKIAQVRELAGFLNVGSHRGRRRVALVHPAEDMNLNAANALLKGLEEPPGGAMFILVSHRPARLLPTIRSRCVAISVGIPDPQAAQAWLKAEGVSDASRWLAYAGGAPLRAREYAEDAETLDRLLAMVQGKGESLPDSREELEALAEALQKLALDRALGAAGLPSIFGTPPGKSADLHSWLRFARQMGQHRALARHPLNARLFAAQMLEERPKR